MSRGTGHLIGGSVLALALIFVLRGVFSLEYALNPCEITHKARTVAPSEAAPGEIVRITGLYEIVRPNCVATFYPVLSWTTPYGPVQLPQPVHRGSFELIKSGPQPIGRTYQIPLAAVSGTLWESRVEAKWDRWQAPLGLSSIHVEYQTVRVKVR